MSDSLESIELSTAVAEAVLIERSMEEGGNINKCVGAERHVETSVEVVNESKVETDKVMAAAVFEWAPFDFPVPNVQSLPYSGPGSFGQIPLRGKFSSVFTTPTSKIEVELIDSLGLLV